MSAVSLQQDKGLSWGVSFGESVGLTFRSTSRKKKPSEMAVMALARRPFSRARTTQKIRY